MWIGKWEKGSCSTHGAWQVLQLWSAARFRHHHHHPRNHAKSPLQEITSHLPELETLQIGTLTGIPAFADGDPHPSNG